MTATKLKLASILERHEEQEGSYSALARAINDSNGLDPDDRALVDRRKLKSIVTADPGLVLSLDELIAIDRYLSQFNQGLARVPLFNEAENVIDALADTGRVSFLLGSKTEQAEFRAVFSHWDVMAMAEVQRDAYHSSPNVHFDLHDVLLHERAERARDAHERGAWAELFADNGPSLVCLGSTRALHATELMLSRMFDVEPFGAGGASARNRVPFHFVWPEDLDHVFPSSFHLSPEKARKLHPGLDATARGLAFETADGPELHVDTLTHKRMGNTHGVAVAQRRRGGQLWICLSGVTGLATLAAARVLREMDASLVPDPGDRESPVYWLPLRGRAVKHPDEADGRTHGLGKHASLAKTPYRWPA